MFVHITEITNKIIMRKDVIKRATNNPNKKNEKQQIIVEKNALHITMLSHLSHSVSQSME